MKECCKCLRTENEVNIWSVNPTLKGMSGDLKQELCTDCLVKMFQLNTNRIKFIEEVIMFRKNNNLYTDTFWKSEQKILFKEILKRKKIPLLKYNFPLSNCYTNGKQYLNNDGFDDKLEDLSKEKLIKIIRGTQ